jgi:membrane-bound lytic murein transglycosylase F
LKNVSVTNSIDLLRKLFTVCTIVALFAASCGNEKTSGYWTSENDYFASVNTHFTGNPLELHYEILRSTAAGTIGSQYSDTAGLAPWNDLIRSAGAEIEWDWRLLASLICQESRFKPGVVSPAGAVGLMQVMPSTGRRLGIDVKASPVENIKAGTLYILKLEKIFAEKVTDSLERKKFILASYNAGPGHVLDAMKLARKHGMNPEKWEGSVEVWLQKKSDPHYFNDELVRNGYFKGTESVAFVKQVMERYYRYREIIPENGENGLVIDMLVSQNIFYE